MFLDRYYDCSRQDAVRLVKDALATGRFDAVQVPFTFVDCEASESCKECRQCVDRCSYHLEIPVLLKRQRSVWDRYLETGRWE